MAQVTQEEKMNQAQGKSPSGKYADGTVSYTHLTLPTIYSV